MSVSRRRPHDNYRRPNKNRDSPARSSALPPILFQLPNLKAQSPQQESAHVGSDPAVTAEPLDNGDLHFVDAAHEEHREQIGELNPGQEIDQASTDGADSDQAVATSEEPTTSRWETWGTRAMTLGIIALAVAWVVVVVRNANVQPNEVAQSEDIDAVTMDIAALDGSAHDLQLDSADINMGELVNQPPAATLDPAMEITSLDPSTSEAGSMDLSTSAVFSMDLSSSESGSMASLFPNINLEAPHVTEPSPLTANLPSEAELNAEFDSSMAAMQTQAQSVSVSIPAPATPALAEDSLESLADLTPTLESAPSHPVETMTPNNFDVTKYAQDVVHAPAKDVPSFSDTPLGVSDWSRYLPPAKTR